MYPSRQNMNKETMALDIILDQIKLIDIYRTFSPNMAAYIFKCP